MQCVFKIRKSLNFFKGMYLLEVSGMSKINFFIIYKIQVGGPGLE